MVLHPIKCEAMHAIFPLRPITLPDLTLDGVPLPVVHEVKLLGVHLNDRLTWSTHVAHVLSTARKRFFILYHARNFKFSDKTMVTMYQWYIRTPMEYAAPVWHPGLTVQQHQQLERVQKRCLRIILGHRYEHYEQALQLLHLQPLYDRREMLTLRLARSMLRHPQHRDLLPPTGHQVHGRNTRHGHRLQQVNMRHARYKNTFVPYAVDMLNTM